MTIKNNSSIEAQLIVDLRKNENENNGINGLDIEFDKREGDNNDGMISLDRHPEEEGKFIITFSSIKKRNRK